MEKAVKSEKIGGYDRYEVRNAMDSIKRYDEIKADAKFLKVVLGEMDREAKKLDASATLLRNTKKRMDKVFKEK